LCFVFGPGSIENRRWKENAKDKEPGTKNKYLTRLNCATDDRTDMAKSRKRKSPPLSEITSLKNGRFQIREHAFWYHLPDQNFPPPTIEQIEDYDGSDRLALACTQTLLKASEQKKLVQRWCEYLPTLKKLKYLWLESRVPQPLFDAATQLSRLTGLYVKWGGIKDFSSISGMTNLRALWVGSNKSLQRLEALHALKKLQWLQFENIPASGDLAFLRGLPQLRGLEICGDWHSMKKLKVKSLKPLEALPKLEWLRLSVITAPADELVSLGKLPKLKYLHLDNTWPMESLADLAGRLPHLDCSVFQPVFAEVQWMDCKKCGQKSLVMVTGKGIRPLCRDCDAERIRRHVEKFEELVAAAKQK
jgi:hypothetical protein